MPELTKAKEPFIFFTRLHLRELTGLRASNLKQLVNLLKTVPGSAVYHHTHHFLQQHQYLSPEPPNDFAYWVNGVLGEERLGEMLAAIDTIQYSTIRALREKIIATIEEYLNSHPTANLRFASEGEEFHFIKAVSFVLPTPYVVRDLKEFMDALKMVTIDSIYFHIFESKLRLEKETNDFSRWIEDWLGDKDLADEIAGLDPYTYTLEGLREKIMGLIETRVKGVMD